MLFAAAIYFGDFSFITAAMLSGMAGIAVDVQQTATLAHVRVTSGPQERPGRC